MGKELPILPGTAQPSDAEQEETLTYSRVFCLREDAPPLRLLLDYLKSKGQIPLHPKMDQAALDDWAWVQISLGYNRENKPIQLFCLRDRGSYKDLLEKEREFFTDLVSVYDDVEAQLVRHYLEKARFLITTGYIKSDITEDGYDFNGWILQFYQENCDGIVQADGQGFFSPKGDLIIEMEDA